MGSPPAAQVEVAFPDASRRHLADAEHGRRERRGGPEQLQRSRGGVELLDRRRRAHRARAQREQRLLRRQVVDVGAVAGSRASELVGEIGLQRGHGRDSARRAGRGERHREPECAEQACEPCWPIRRTRTYNVLQWARLSSWNRPEGEVGTQAPPPPGGGARRGARGRARPATAPAPRQDGARARRRRLHRRRVRDRRAAGARPARGQQHRQQLRRLRRHLRRGVHRGAVRQRRDARGDDAGRHPPGQDAVQRHRHRRPAAPEPARVRAQGRHRPLPRRVARRASCSRSPAGCR